MWLSGKTDGDCEDWAEAIPATLRIITLYDHNLRFCAVTSGRNYGSSAGRMRKRLAVLMKGEVVVQTCLLIHEDV